MCRLFAVRSAEPVSVATAFETLKQQSHEHKDGWGLALFDSPQQVRFERDLKAAHASERFSELGKSLTTTNLLLHLRLASVGEVTPKNSHPFTHGRWTFAHNGTIKRFVTEPARLEERIAPQLRSRMTGETDSERCFFRFLTHLGDGTAPQQVAQALARTFDDIEELYDLPGKDRPSLNFIAADGQLTAVTRRGRSLWHAKRPGLHLIASEPTDGHEGWAEVPEDSVIVIDDRLHAHQYDVGSL